MQTPSIIEYGVVYDTHRLLSSDQIEARVRLHLQGAVPGSDEVEFITSVSPLEGETDRSLKTRLVVSAARLFRQMELRQKQTRALPARRLSPVMVQVA